MSGPLPTDLELKHRDIDGAHGELFRLLAAAAQAWETRSAAEVTAAVTAFAEAMLAHAAEEDRLMEASLFPDRARHRMAHEIFLADIQRLREELATTGTTPAVGEWLRLRVPEWLRFHIAVNDARLAQHLAERKPASASARRATRRVS